jgi:hypothetical protein
VILTDRQPRKAFKVLGRTKVYPRHIIVEPPYPDRVNRRHDFGIWLNLSLRSVDAAFKYLRDGRVGQGTVATRSDIKAGGKLSRLELSANHPQQHNEPTKITFLNDMKPKYVDFTAELTAQLNSISSDMDMVNFTYLKKAVQVWKSKDLVVLQVALAKGYGVVEVELEVHSAAINFI